MFAPQLPLHWILCRHQWDYEKVKKSERPSPGWKRTCHHCKVVETGEWAEEVLEEE